MTEEQIGQIVERAVFKAFRDLGLQVHEDDLFESRKDLTFLREWRHTCEEVRSKGVVAMAGLTLTGVIALLLLGFKDWIFH